jgi:hypothetical protein
MQWDELFADLEGEFEAGKRAEQDAEIAEQTRAELAQLTFAHRLWAQLSSRITIEVAGVGPFDGVLRRMGPDFVLLDTGVEAVIPLAAIVAARGLAPDARAAAGVNPVAARLPLRSALRGLAADRAYVVVHRRTGQADGGTLSRIGADFLDLSVHDAADAPRSGAVRATITVPTPALAAVVRRSPPW